MVTKKTYKPTKYCYLIHYIYSFIKIYVRKLSDCNSRLLQSHMRFNKNRPYNHWLKSQGHYLLCFYTSKRSEPIRFTCDMRLKTRYSLKATTKIPPPPPPALESKKIPILRSQITQNTRTPLKTGLEHSVQLLFIRQWNFDPFQMDQPYLALLRDNNNKTHSRKINWVLTYQHTRELVSNLRINGELSLIQ